MQTLSKEELIKIILSSIEGTYDIGTYLDRRQKIDQVSPDSSIAAIIAEIDSVTSQELFILNGEFSHHIDHFAFMPSFVILQFGAVKVGYMDAL